ncbi:MAG TPA: 50S ribosomal protein L25 [Fimbriimonadaceae bacterium]|nr:50S ribosomal protein L25 [Fimbriimonadaceae bacterium]
MSSLQVEPREENVAPKHLRKRGLVPMALVDDQKQIRLVQAPVTEVKRAISQAHGAGVVEVQISGEKGTLNTVVKGYEQEVLTRRLLSVTLMQVSMDEEITVDVPIVSLGTPEAVEAGTALLNHPLSALKLKGKVKDMPDQIEVDISHLEVGHHINAGDITLPPGMTLATSPDATLFSVQIAREEVLEPEVAEEGGAEPEVIGEEATEQA